ncbi:hypothetical protein HPB49_005303 [Dermacentor silvarum]|uniref:Uncharacterized protein n=1 Tax=Dermacentor silvarum TaxID=543639 RepID=A0ACB8DMD0_DERSI|nr:hypothetical protein HPB49_005303 [Dermacentor silvarum]
MVVTALRGYDPTTLAWKNVPASTPEDSVPPTDIVDEGLFTVMTLRKRRQQSKAAKASATDKATSAKTPPKKNTSRVSWRPAAMPRTAAGDFAIVLKPRVTVDLKAAFQSGEVGTKLASYVNATNSDCISVCPIWAQSIIVVSTNDINTANLLSREFSLKTSQGPLLMIGHAKISGEVCCGVITVHEQETFASLKAKIHWRGGNIAFIRKLGKTSVALLTFEGHHVPRFVHYNSVVTPVREYKRTIPASYCCGTVGHRPELCPHRNDQRCGHCGQVVGASEEGMTPHECKPSCLECGEGHLTGSPACEAKFCRLQQPGGQHCGRGSPQQWPKPKTSDVTPEGRQPGATNQTPKNNQQVPHPPKTSQASQKTSSKIPGHGAPVFQAGEFPPLTSGGAPRQPAKKTSSQLADSNWVNRCNTAARQMSGRNTWRLFRSLIDPAQTRGNEPFYTKPSNLYGASKDHSLLFVYKRMVTIIRNEWDGFHPLTNLLYVLHLAEQLRQRYRHRFRDDDRQAALVWSEVERWRDSLLHYTSLCLFVGDNFKTAP